MPHAEAQAQDGNSLTLARVIEQTINNNLQVRGKMQRQTIEDDMQKVIAARFAPQFFADFGFVQQHTQLPPFERLWLLNRGLQPVAQYNSGFGTLRTGIYKTMPSGLKLHSALAWQTLHNNLPYGDNAQYNGIGNWQIGFSQPLLKNFRTNDNTTALRYQSLLFEAVKAETEFAVSQQVLEVMLCYWTYVAAAEELTIKAAAEKRANQVYEDTKILIAADKKPAADLIQIEADLAEKTAQRIYAEQALHSARLNLGRAIGLNVIESQQLSMPREYFPLLKGSSATSVDDFGWMVSYAVAERGDLKARNLRQKAEEARMRLAQNNVNPQLDLTGFAGLQVAGNEQYLPMPVPNQANVGIGLQFSMPLGNNQAKHELSIAKSIYYEAQLAAQDKARNIEIDVNMAINNLLSSWQALEQSKIALEKYKIGYQNELIKFQQGITTLFNVIQFQDKLTLSELNFTRAQKDYAVMLSNLHFQIGSLQPENVYGSEQSLFEIPQRKD